MEIERFPLYRFNHDGTVVSHVRFNSKVLKPIRMGSYVGLQLVRNDGKLEKIYLHRAICEANIGACPDGLECRHLDGDKTNNKSSNLTWGTRLENIHDKSDHGTELFGEDNPMSVLTELSVLKMRECRNKTGNSYKKIAVMFNVSTMTAYRAIVGKSWGHI